MNEDLYHDIVRRCHAFLKYACVLTPDEDVGLGSEAVDRLILDKAKGFVLSTFARFDSFYEDFDDSEAIRTALALLSEHIAAAQEWIDRPSETA